MSEAAHELVSVCARCGVELGRQASGCAPAGVSHGLCRLCVRHLLLPAAQAARALRAARGLVRAFPPRR
ncbi:MAG: hypothetical protein ACYDA8_05930 [Deferrisomatales bacterium]